MLKGQEIDNTQFFIIICHMASISLINKVKYSTLLYNVYYYMGSMAVRILRLFVKKDPYLIVFSSYGGRRFDDSPKCIYDRMLIDSRFDSFKIVWAFMHPENFDIPHGDKVKTDSLAYYIVLLKARCWITNSTMERGLNIKCTTNFYFNTWHGTPIKLMGSDIIRTNNSFSSKGSECPYDVFCAQSEYDADIFARSFRLPKQIIKIIGLPRNDELAMGSNTERKQSIKYQLGINDGKRVILYAPTFREYRQDNAHNCVFAPPISLPKWKELLGKDYVLLIRAHYEVVRILNITNDDFVIDVSSYPILNDLIIVSDMLISDYSSIFFDYAVTGKPMLCFAYDYDEYQKKRGLYFDIREELECDGFDSEDQIINEIKVMDVRKRELVTCKFRNKYVTSYGTATKQSLDLIFNGINGEN